MAELTQDKVERREFNRWFVETFADPDHSFTHIPRWMKSDLWLAWQAGRAALARKETP